MSVDSITVMVNQFRSPESSQVILLQEVEISKLEESSVNSLRMQLLTIDLDRVVFLLRSYLKVRLQKVKLTQFHLHSSVLFFKRFSFYSD